MSILITKNSKVLVQGFTGKEATFHSKQMISYGTKIIAGVTPGKGSYKHLNIPVFNSVEEVINIMNIDVSIIFVPPKFASDAIIESIYAGIKLIICITEGIPILDMVMIKKYILYTNSKLIGPNCPGIITPNESKVGIMPGEIFKKGNIGIISRSGTLTYEAADQVVKYGYGISTAIGIGGDPIIGMDIKELLKLFIEDIDTHAIIIIGEIGGNLEIEAAKWLKKNNLKKPIIGFIAGQTAPKGRTMGHAGAIIGNEYDTAISKMDIMYKSGIYIVKSLANIGKELSKIMKKYYKNILS